MHGTHADELIGIGLIPLHKVQRGRGGSVAAVNIGRHEFKLRDGSSEQHAVFAVDGQAVIRLSAAGKVTHIPLKRRKVESRPRYKTIYVDYTVPADPHVPDRLRHAATHIRLDSGGVGEVKNSRRPQYLRAFPEHEDLFQELFGRRNDIESLNNELKSRLQARRLRIPSGTISTCSSCFSSRTTAPESATAVERPPARLLRTRPSSWPRNHSSNLPPLPGRSVAR